LRADAAAGADLEPVLAAFEETGLISPRLIASPRAIAALESLRADLIRTASKVEAIDTALSLRDERVLRGLFAIIAPVGGAREDAWLTPDDVLSAAGSRELSSEENAALAAWADFTAGWQSNNAAQVNAAAARLADVLPTINAGLYPSTKQLAVESWYFRAKNMTWVWLVYALSFAPLLLFVVFRWRGAFWIGMGLYSVAFLLQTASIALRWYVSGRWPNTNMFEAVTTAAWFGVVFALLLEAFVLRRSAVRGLVALGGAAAGMVALMAAYYMPAYLNPHIGNAMPVLHDVWLYIHTNVIIFSYCLIFMAAVTALLYLLHRAVLRLTSPAELDVSAQFARVGGAGSLIMTRPDGSAYLGGEDRAKTSLGQVLDGTTMILMELSFVLLWAGIVMGAIWADHSWGRPWGWDPKEVFALNTFIVFAILIHARMKVKDKGLWTAWIAIVGCLVMLFNWIIINFTIAGLHSYAGS
jgi:cytochrome c-type biogenesis protein CcsB